MPITDDDFFKQLAGNQPAPKTPSTDEIVFRDESGKMKVLKGGEVFDFVPYLIRDSAPKKELIKETLRPAVKEEVKPIKPVAREIISVPQLAAPLDFDRTVEDIIKKSGLKLDDPDKIKRLKNIIFSRLKNIRDQIEIREILADSPLAGGLGFDAALVEKILALVNEELKRQDGQKERGLPTKSLDELFIPLALKTEVKAEQNEPLKPLPVMSDLPQKPAAEAFELKPLNQPEYPAGEEKTTPAADSSLSAAEKKELAELAAKISAPLQPINQKLPAAPKAEALPLAEKKAEVKSAQGAMPASGMESAFGGEEKPEDKKPKPKEVKFQERLVDPVVEIKTMKLVDFRRLAKTAKEAAEKILEKIALLEKDSFTKKVQGIKAWKENEICRLYLAIARQSILENKSMSEVINLKKQAGLPILTEEELAAVIELNQRLRY